MIDQKIRDLIVSLREKTKNKEAIWNKTSKSIDQFTLILNNGKITITKLIARDGKLLFTFSIFNLTGDRIYETTEVLKNDFLTQPDYDLLKDFYDIVKRVYYRVDETIDSILTETKKKGELGKEQQDVDDLPF